MSAKHASRAGQPSAMERTFKCPGWVARSHKLDNPETEWAREGTAAHKFAAHLLETGFNAEKFYDWWIDPDADDIGLMFQQVVRDDVRARMVQVTEEMVENVQFYVDQCRALVAEGDHYWLEAKVDLTDYHRAVWGTTDFGRFRPSTGELIALDKKNGFQTISPVENAQLMSYALGLCLRPECRGYVHKIWLGICQPRGLGDPIQWWHISPEDLYKWGYEMAKAVTGAEAVLEQRLFGPLNSLDSLRPYLSAGAHCQWCPAFGACEVAAAWATQAQAVHQPDDGKFDFSTYSPEQLAHYLTIAPFARKWAKAVENFCAHEAEKGRAVPGYKLKETLGHSKWKDETALDAWAEENDLAEDDLFEYKRRSPAQVKARIGKQYADFLDPFITRPKIGSKLVPADDDAVEKTPNIHLEFQPRTIEGTAK